MVASTYLKVVMIGVCRRYTCTKDGSFSRRRIESASKFDPLADPIRQIDSASGPDPPGVMGKWGPPKMGTQLGKWGPPVWQTIFWELKDPIQLCSSNQQLDNDKPWKHRSGFSTSTTAKAMTSVQLKK